MIGSQAFSSTTAFNMNIGTWNTASVTTLSSVLAPLRPSRTSQPRNRSADAAVSRRKQSRRRCGLHPKVEVGQSRRRFGRVGSEPSPGADVGGFLVQKWAKSRRRCGSTKQILLHENILQRAASCLRRRHGTVVAVGFGAVRCGPRVVGLQAFYYASAFNMNIGGWNTASVKTLSSV